MWCQENFVTMIFKYKSVGGEEDYVTVSNVKTASQCDARTVWLYYLKTSQFEASTV